MPVPREIISDDGGAFIAFNILLRSRPPLAFSEIYRIITSRTFRRLLKSAWKTVPSLNGFSKRNARESLASASSPSERCIRLPSIRPMHMHGIHARNFTVSSRVCAVTRGETPRYRVGKRYFPRSPDRVPSKRRLLSRDNSYWISRFVFPREIFPVIERTRR